MKSEMFAKNEKKLVGISHLKKVDQVRHVWWKRLSAGNH
jgi:hypothetical protein